MQSQESNPQRLTITSHARPDLTETAGAVTARTNQTIGIETFFRKNLAVSEQDLSEMQTKSEKMCKELNDAKERRNYAFDSLPAVKDLRTQNDDLRHQNERLTQELEYYKQYSKEKQTELFA